MTTNILPLFYRLHQAAPEMCGLAINNSYDIGPYRFNFLSDGSLQGSTGLAVDTGRPALAWLSDALMAECEVRGWHVGTKTAYLGKHVAEVYNQSACRDSLAEALLTALVAAVEAERVR